MYDKPNRTIDIYGNNIYAYVTSLHKNNLFNFPKLLVLAYTLIKTGSKTDRVCIVSNDISDDYIDVLKLFYKVIKSIDYDIHNTSYLKYMSLNLTNYKKILIINPNFLILYNPDFLFKLHAPSAYFKSSNYISNELILLEPEINQFDTMISILSNQMSRVDESEFIYNYYYSRKWNQIEKDYFYQGTNLINIDRIKYIYYTFSPINITFADINIDDIYLLWFNIYEEMLGHFPHLISNNLLSGTNKMLTHIMKNKLSRSTTLKETEISDIKNIYETNEIHINLKKYYHILRDFEPLLNDNIVNSSESEKNINNDDEMLSYIKSVNGNNISIHINENLNENIIYKKILKCSKKVYQNLNFFKLQNISYNERIQNTINDDFIELEIKFIKNKEKNLNINMNLAEQILCKNNLEFLENLDIESLIKPNMNINLLYIHTLCNWINSNLTIYEKDRFILFGDIHQGSLGKKVINKIEGIFMSNGNDSSEYEKNLENLINENLCGKNGFHFTRITKENSKEFNKYHKNIYDSIKNKENYYYFYGLKISLDLNI